MVTIQWMFWIHWTLVMRRLNATDHSEANTLPGVDLSTSKPQGKDEINEDNPGEYVLKKRHQRSLLSLRSTTDPTSNGTRNGTRHVSQNESIPYVPITRHLLLFNSSVIHVYKVDLKPPDFEFYTTAQTPQVQCQGKTYSCTNKCSNTTTFVRYSIFNYRIEPKCRCDPACNKIFMDCCSDFAKLCGIVDITDDNDDVNSHKSKWRCVNKLNISLEGCVNTGGLSIWMIARCPRHWPNDNIKQKCHGAASKLDFKSYNLFAPVVGSSDQLTYRNQYCAKCNNVSRFEYWPLIFKKDAVPPPFNTPEELTIFLTNNARYFNGVAPRHGQRMRWCHYPNVISNCSTKSHNARESCLNGTVSLVESEGKVYKNKGCALCNENKATCGVAMITTNPCSIDPTSISRAISLRDYGVSIDRTCARNQVYDPYLSKCRQSYEWSNLESGAKDKYHVTLWILKKQANEYYERYLLKNGIAQYFKMNESQITIKDVINKMDEFQITFTLWLTLSQSLSAASDPHFLGTSNETIGLRRLFKFRKAFALPTSRSFYTVYKLRVRQLTCIRPRIYRFGEYAILDDLRIRVNSTGSVYGQDEYFINITEPNATVTVCLKLSAIVCNGSFIKLNTSEYHFIDNLTLIYHSLSYNFGDYLYHNKTVSICVEFIKNYTISGERKDSLALVVLTWVGFILSIICLFALLLTYFIFKELRTLPGKNLINLCASLCFAEILWLGGSSIKGNQVACTAIAIANHYLFLVFFTSSSVISFHSCLVFGKKINIRRSKSEQNKMFLVYCFVAWGIPGLFVLIFSLLDHHGIFIVDYGRSDTCWLGTKQSKIFLFILPFGILILFNLFLFSFVAMRLYKNQKSSAKALEKVARERQRQNVIVCIKLSTLMGFSWLFGLLQVAVETETDVFLFLFVIFVSFQGLFICLAFLIKRTNYRLYSSLISKDASSKSTSAPSRPSNKTVGDQQDTKL